MPSQKLCKKKCGLYGKNKNKYDLRMHLQTVFIIAEEIQLAKQQKSVCWGCFYWRVLIEREGLGRVWGGSVVCLSFSRVFSLTGVFLWECRGGGGSCLGIFMSRDVTSYYLH